MPGCHSHNLSTRVFTWNDMRLFLQKSHAPTRKQNWHDMVCFSNLRLICHYVQKEFFFFFFDWPGWTQEEQMPSVSKRVSRPPPALNLLFFLRTGYVQQHITLFADLQISNGSLCFASAAMAPVRNKSMLIQQPISCVCVWVCLKANLSSAILENLRTYLRSAGPASSGCCWLFFSGGPLDWHLERRGLLVWCAWQHPLWRYQPAGSFLGSGSFWSHSATRRLT